MQGRKQYEQPLFTMVNLAEMIPENHLLVRIDRAINLDFIYELTSELYCSYNGRPSIDPVMFFRMQLVGYLYGIESDRRLCEEIHLNLAYRWFCRLHLEDRVPDHSSLTRIRDRFGVDTYQSVFEKLIHLLKDNGFITGQQIMMDASLVEADASINSLRQREDTDSKARALRNYEKRYHDFREGNKQRKVSNQTHVSQTDHDATLVARSGTYGKLYYKVHYAIEDKNRFIVDCQATTGAKHECTILPDRIDYLQNQMGLSIEEVVADKGYGRGPTYGFLRERGIRAYVPLHDDNLGQGRLSRAEFKYDRKHDRYICPNKKYLYPYDKLDKGLIKRYRIVGGHCRRCPFRARCLPENYQNRARFVYRNPYQDEIDKIKRRQETAYFKDRLKRRQWKLEGLFGEAKENHCLRRARYRGIKKVQIQFYMIAIVQNFKRLLSLIFSLFMGIFLILRSSASPKNNFACTRIQRIFGESQIFADAA